ncbi:cysteine--tRNA ligase [Candidatus Adlerbacteria bacterium RIFOXYC1_FULL_48_26]|uniref:Cysteine--tRNA ligase n=1 Tax=Candidatus Adlerbacteria bacterium RIFOXYC1_FULL_48_26 TaxID=1797247 RepID=A0A1F4Y4S7_9BACT|nr:MAG: cysteine--tRNA ligase [Candidatus Adlerbacteria bacterium RIFOXYC1_FULL_48_26]OGC93732.1 MAG: cysteine--tRNA ligase [Candidatus Adlerbacteria bacterium RIFOXYB1_FULL_48_10]
MFSFFKRAAVQKDLPPLTFHNTLSGTKEEFRPLNHTVRMYNCGPTPYDEQHIGNMVPALLGNLLRRSLETWGYPVNQVTNITDFGHLSGDNDGNADLGEDRMSRGLKREGWDFTMENMRKLAEKYTEIFLHDIASLGVPTNKIKFPRASDYIKEEIALVRALEEKGYAYVISDGVYFDTKKFIGYGKLGGLADSGPTEARIEGNSEKKNPRDFALWKFAEGEKKLGWESPWGKGFPGWHIECTAMIFALLGKQIDIHTGGIEHIPVHHNNEIAQAEAVTGKQYVRYWLHNAHITIEGKKISKSLGNTVYLHNIVDKGLNPLALRYWFMTGHYRTPMNFTWDALEGADAALSRLTRAYLEMKEGKADEVFLQKFYTCIANDLGTAQALALVWENLSTLNKATLRQADRILGLGFADARPPQKLTVLKQEDLPEEIKELVEEREEARSTRDFSKSDHLRGRLEELGFTVTDSAEGQKITKK